MCRYPWVVRAPADLQHTESFMWECPDSLFIHYQQLDPYLWELWQCIFPMAKKLSTTMDSVLELSGTESNIGTGFSSKWVNRWKPIAVQKLDPQRAIWFRFLFSLSLSWLSGRQSNDKILAMRLVLLRDAFLIVLTNFGKISIKPYSHPAFSLFTLWHWEFSISNDVTSVNRYCSSQTVHRCHRVRPWWYVLL